MTCDFLALERDHLFREIFPLLNISDPVDTNHNFKLIMSSRNPDVLTPLGKYIHVGFQKRENTKSDITVYPKKYAHGFVVLCFVVVMQSFIMNSHEVLIHIHQACFAGTGAIVRLPQCQWSKSDGYGKISQYITTRKHSKAVTVCIFLGIYCILWYHVSRIDNAILTTECRELSLQWFFCCWWHCWLSLWHLAVPPVAAGLLSWRPFVFWEIVA